MTRARRRPRSGRSQAGLLVAIVVLSLGLTGCYTQLQMTGEDPAAEAPRAEQAAQEAPTYADEYHRSVTHGDSGRAFDPASPVASLRRARPESRAELVSLAKSLQAARDNTEISFDEYREGVHFFRTNYPSFYGNYFGDPFYATYDIEYERTTQAALAASRAIHPENSFWRIEGFFCAPSSYDPAFGCRGWLFAPSDFFFLPASLAFHGAGRFGPMATAVHRSFLPTRPGGYYAFGSGYGFFGSRYGYGGWGSGPYVGALVGTSVNYSDVDDNESSRRDDRDDKPRGGTMGRGGTSADRGPGRAARRALSGTRGETARDGDQGRTGALASIEEVTLEPVRVSGADIQGASRAEKLRIFRALQRIAEESGDGTLSIDQRNEISEHIRRLVRAQERGLPESQDGRSRTRSPNDPNMGRGEQASERRGTRVGRGSSGSDRGASRSGSRDRSNSGDSGRDRSRSGSGGNR